MVGSGGKLLRYNRFRPGRSTRVNQAAAEGPKETAAEWIERRLGFSPDETQRRLLDTVSNRVLLNCTRQWGKSTVTAARAVYQAWTVPESLTLVASPSGRQSAEFVRKAAGFMKKLGERVKGDGDNDISLAFGNGSRIVGLPGNEATVRGFSAVSLLLVDEASRVSEAVYEAVRPMVAVGGGALWLLSTPWGKRGFFWETWDRGGAEWERTRVPATECPRIPVDYLEQERRTMGDRYFRQEFLCEFVETEDAVFDREMIERAFTDDFEPMVFEKAPWER